ncbi:MAG: OmpA family protein [Myxococcota bacterium]
MPTGLSLRIGEGEIELVPCHGSCFARIHPATVEEIAEALRHIDAPSELAMLVGETGESTVADLVERVLEQIARGRMHVQYLCRPHVDAVLREPAAPLASYAEPEPIEDDETEAVFSIRVVDEIGEPIAGQQVSVKHEGRTEQVQTDANGVATLRTTGVSFATATLADEGALVDALRPRWATARSGEPLSKAVDLDVCFLPTTEPITASLRAGVEHTVSIQPDVRLVRLLGFHFDPKSSFLLPTAVPNIRALADLYESNPNSTLLVVGHAGPQSEGDIADAVALERAQSVAAYLRDDVADWLERYETNGPTTRWGASQDKLMLRSLPDYPEKPAQEHGVRWFQRTRDLSVDGIAGPQTRTQLITEYMQHDGTTLPEGASLEVHGAGAGFPLPGAEDEAAYDGHTDQEHRRVELFFFGEPLGVLPESPGESSTEGDPQYPEWCRRAREVVDLSAEGSTREVTMLEMADVLFRTNSCVVMPDSSDPSSDPVQGDLEETTGAIASALRYASQHEGKKVLVAGHCDTTGTVQFNQPLSEERAEVVLALLVGDRDAFGDACHARHRVSDYKQILAWFSQRLGFDCHPGAIDDNPGSGIAAVRGFQRDYNTNKAAIGATGPDLAEDGMMGPATWRGIFDCYEHLLRQDAEEDAAGLARLREALVFVDDSRRSLGFSEHHPIDVLGRDGFKSQANRRVEILFFDEGEEPDLDRAGGDPQMSEIYLPGRYERVPLDRQLSANSVGVRLCQPDGTPSANAEYTLSMDREMATGVTDGDGNFVVHLDRKVVSFWVDWVDEAITDPEQRSQSREVIIELDESEQADHDRMTNLGYFADTLPEQLQAYRAEFGRDPSVPDATLRDEARAWHDGGPRPTQTLAASA